ncbi:MAG: guanylate kinase [Candidatus Bruticola sp.]
MEEKKRPGLLLVISGPSGAGKGTVVSRILAKRQDCALSVSCTTRKPRVGEQDGINYYFISSETFNEWVNQDKFLEWDSHFSACYGTPKEFVEQKRREGKHIILEIDVKGGLEVMRKSDDCVSIFLAPPSWKVLEERLCGRGTESSEQVAERLLRARTEMKHMDQYKYTVINDDIDEAVNALNSIIEAEMALTPRVNLNLDV